MSTREPSDPGAEDQLEQSARPDPRAQPKPESESCADDDHGPVAGVPSVLFLCVHNAGRSQMAAGWLRTLGAGRVRVLSAGSEPAATLNPRAVEVMDEVDIDIANEQPQRWTEAMLGEVDVVVTMGCGDTCPYVPGTRYIDWPLPDPAGQPIDMVRGVRDLIRERVVALLDDLVPPDLH